MKRIRSHKEKSNQIAYWRGEAMAAREELKKLRRHNAALARGRERVIQRHGKDHADEMFKEVKEWTETGRIIEKLQESLRNL